MNAHPRKKQQWIVVGGTLAIILLALVGANIVMRNSTASFVTAPQTSGVDTTIIADRTSHAPPEMSWITQSSREVEAMQAEVARLETELATQRAEAEKAKAEIMDEFSETLVAMQAEINKLSAQNAQPVTDTAQAPGPAERLQAAAASMAEDIGGLEFFSRTQPGTRSAQGRGLGMAVASANGGGAGGVITDGLAQPPRFGTAFALNARPERSGASADAPKDLGSYVPAGSYAPAMVISGVDASTGVVSQENPVPVTLRITGPAVTAGQGTTRGRKIDLTGCTLVGSARGDLSSERVYVRLDTLTCLAGDFAVERQVAGFVAGSGKAGVRGQVVSREGNLTSKAAIAGALEGLAGAADSIGQAGLEQDNAQVSDMLKSAGAASLAGATANAASTLADYYIRRAEQYQPVVSLYGGSEVEVVFIEGVDLSLEGK